MTPYVNNLEADCLDKFSDNSGKIRLIILKRTATSLMKTLGKAKETGVKIDSSAVSENTKTAFSTIPGVILFSLVINFFSRIFYQAT